MPKLALVGAPDGSTELLHSQLQAAGWETFDLAGPDAWSLAGLDADAAIAFDGGLPIDEVVRECRRTRSDIPVFAASSDDSSQTRLRLLDAGARDVFPVPLNIMQVAVRALHVLRSEYPERLPAILHADGVELDRDRRLVKRRGKFVHLSPTDLRLLELLMFSPGTVLSREEIVAALWSDDPDVRERSVDVRMKRLRDGLNRGLKDDPISAVRGQGYVIRPSRLHK